MIQKKLLIKILFAATLLLVMLVAFLIMNGSKDKTRLTKVFKWNESSEDYGFVRQIQVIRGLDSKTDAEAYRSLAGLNVEDVWHGTPHVRVPDITINLDHRGERFMKISVVVSVEDMNQRERLKRQLPAIQAQLMALLMEFVERKGIHSGRLGQHQGEFEKQALKAVQRRLHEATGSTLIADLRVASVESN